MGRKSKLTEEQWEEIKQRLLAGEIAAALAEEYKINRAAISRRFSDEIATVKDVANQILTTEVALRALPIAQQINAINLADQLRAISGHLAGAANYGAATSHRLSAIAHSQVQFLDDVEPLNEAGVEKLKVIAALTRTANDAAATGVALINANRDRMSEVPPMIRTTDPKKLSDATLKELLASRA